MSSGCHELLSGREMQWLVLLWSMGSRALRLGLSSCSSWESQADSSPLSRQEA